MRHLKALTKASMTWHDPTILDYVNRVLSFLVSILPALNTLAEAKDDEPAGER